MMISEIEIRLSNDEYEKALGEYINKHRTTLGISERLQVHGIPYYVHDPPGPGQFVVKAVVVKE